MLIGHSHIVSFFDSVIQSGNLSHAYALCGPEFLGKKTLALDIAARLLQTSVDKLALHPDFYFVTQERNEKTEKLKKNIDIDQVRSLRSALQKTATAGRAVVILDPADRLNASSRNALLKTLEEPRGNTVIFLIARSADSLGSTIVSRCQVFSFAPVAPEVLSAFAETVSGDESEKQEMVRHSQGLPGLLVSWLRDPESFVEYKQVHEQFVSLFSVPFAVKRQRVEELFGDKTDHIEAREKLISTLAVWERSLALLLVSDSIADKKSLVEVYDKILAARTLLAQNIHPRLLVEQILLALP